jgi:molybdenum cofactor cytidylyltransferase
MGERNKALLPIGGQTFLSAIAGHCAAAAIEEVVVVVAEPHLENTRNAAKALGLGWVKNEHPEQGMGSSVALAFDFALANFVADSCWLWPVDVPSIPEGTLQTLATHGRPNSVVIPCFEDRGGHPVLVARGLWKELADCAGAPEGARTVFRRDPKRVIRVAVNDEGVRLDVDSPEDLDRLRGGSAE